MIVIRHPAAYELGMQASGAGAHAQLPTAVRVKVGAKGEQAGPALT